MQPHEGISIMADSEDHSSLVIGYYKKKTAKTLVGGVSENKKIRERVDSEGQYGRWRLRVMGSCSCVSKSLCIFVEFHQILPPVGR